MLKNFFKKKIKKNKFFMISGNSGSGKDTLINLFLKKNKNFEKIISTTSRPKRDGEKDGVDYYFLNSKDFEEKIANKEFIEWSKVHGKYYGIYKKEILDKLKEKNVITDIDVQGYDFFKKNTKLPIYGIFLEIKNLDQMLQRINKRGNLEKKDLEERIKSFDFENKEKEKYDAILESIEGDIEKTYKNFEKKISENIL